MKLDPVTLDAVRHWLQIGRLAAVVIFVALGIRIIVVRSPAQRRRAINMLLAYVLVLHAGLAIFQQDAWPFSNYPMMSVDVSDPQRMQQMIVFRAVDARGGEWQVEPNCWSPLYPQNLAAWLNVVGRKLPDAERQMAMRYLLRGAEAARQRRAGGERYFGNAALLGPLAAPDVDLLPPVEGCPLPFRGLRFYSQWWRPTEHARGVGQIDWRLEWEVFE